MTADTITLGVLTDLHGEFAVGGTTGTLGNRLYWQDQNAKGGICGRKVKLVVKDHGYDVQQAVTDYAQMKGNILALQQLLGSPMTAALSQQLEAQHMLAIPESWASTLLSNEDFMIVGDTYHVEMINAVDHMVEKGKLHRGDTIGHIYQEGEYGEDALLGTKYVAKKACKDKDLTSKGVERAFRSLSDVDTGGTVVPLDYTKKGAPPSTKSYIYRPDESEVGGLKRVEQKPYQGKDVVGYTAPALKGH